MDKYIVAPPLGSTNNSVGAEDGKWQAGYFEKLPNWQEYLAESTGYGIVSGCEPTISGLTVTVGAGVVHLADGTRKEIAQTNITLDPADSTNPRIDLVYITSAGEVTKVTGTASASPVVPALPTGGISVCNVTVAANATTGTVKNISDVLPRLYNTDIISMADCGTTGDGITDVTPVFARSKTYFLPDEKTYLVNFREYNKIKPKVIGNGRIKYDPRSTDPDTEPYAFLENSAQFSPAKSAQSEFYADMMGISEGDSDIMWLHQLDGGWLWAKANPLTLMSLYQDYDPWGQVAYNKDYQGEIPNTFHVWVKLNPVIRVERGRNQFYEIDNPPFYNACLGKFLTGQDQTETTITPTYRQDGFLEFTLSATDITQNILHFWTNDTPKNDETEGLIYSATYYTDAPDGMLLGNLASDLKRPKTGTGGQEIGGTKWKVINGVTTLHFSNLLPVQRVDVDNLYNNVLWETANNIIKSHFIANQFIGSNKTITHTLNYFTSYTLKLWKIQSGNVVSGVIANISTGENSTKNSLITWLENADSALTALVSINKNVLTITVPSNLYPAYSLVKD